MGLEFGEGQIDGIEIGTVRRQVAHLGSTGSDLLADTSHLVGGEVVEDDDVARMQLGTENVLEISGENLGIDRPLDEERRGDAIPPPLTHPLLESSKIFRQYAFRAYAGFAGNGVVCE